MTDVLDIAPEVRAYEAREVRHLLNHEGWRIACAATEARIVRQWKAAQTTAERDQCWHKLQAFMELKQELQGFGARTLASPRQE